MFRNAASCIAENAYLMRALLPGAPMDKGKKKKRQRSPALGDNSHAGSDASKKTKVLSGYTLFVKEMRVAEVAANPGQKPTGTMKRMGEEWRKLTPDNKEKWNMKAKKQSQGAIVGAV